MNDFILNTWVFGIVISIFGYQIGLFMKKKYKLAIFNPLLISIFFVMLLLLIFHVDYDSYFQGAKYLGDLLTPATICLAIPLYRQLDLLKKNLKAIIGGITAGVLTSLASIYLLALLFHFSHQQYVTLLPKSITTAIGMGISEVLGGIVTISVLVIIITGVMGNLIAEGLCKLCRIHEPIAKGLAIGTSAHVMGTAKAMEMGEVEGAMSSLAIVVAGLLTVIGASIFANFL